jgi:hypothetical protein
MHHIAVAGRLRFDIASRARSGAHRNTNCGS